MARIEFTAHLRELAPQGPTEVPGASVAEVLANLFKDHERLKGYILDDQDRLRKHVCIFVDGERRIGADALDFATHEGSEIYVMQALSGG